MPAAAVGWECAAPGAQGAAGRSRAIPKSPRLLCLLACAAQGVAVTAASAFMAFSWAFLPLLLGGGLVMGTAVTAGARLLVRSCNWTTGMRWA